MKMIRNSLIALTLFCGLTLQAQNAVYSLVLTNSSTNVVFTRSVNISKVVINNGSTVTGTVSLYDNSVAGITYTNASYISRSAVMTNVVEVITNSLGFLQTNTYPGIYTMSVTNAAATNNLPTMSVLSAPASGTYTDVRWLVLTKGLVIVPNTSNITATVYYSFAP